MSNVIYHFADVQGSEIRQAGITRGIDLPVAIRLARFEGDDLHITLEYLHTKPVADWRDGRRHVDGSRGGSGWGLRGDRL